MVKKIIDTSKKKIDVKIIEEVFNALTPATAIQIDDIHINSLEHDEGLFEPYGTVTVNVDIAYRHA